MDIRGQRGLELAATRTIRKRDGWWFVPSQTGNGMYRVQLTPKFATCECPDFGNRGVKCKHIFAATIVMRREAERRWQHYCDTDRHLCRDAANDLSARMGRLQRCADQ